jgi:hypothetical protein
MIKKKMIQKKMNKRLLILISIIFGAILLISGSAYANSGVVFEFESEPLFNEANFLPGNGVTKWVKVTNNSGESQPIATEAINWSGFPNSGDIPSDDLSRALDIVIRIKSGSDLYGGSGSPKTLYDFYGNGETHLSNVNDGAVVEYEFEIFFPQDKENEWQEETTSFDILVGIQGQEGGNGGGTSGGGAALPPGLTISMEEAEVINCCGDNPSAIITWNTNYYSTSQVVYGTDPGVFDLSEGPANYYGYSFAAPDPEDSSKVKEHSVTLTGLLLDTTYYYRCVSHASPPTIGKEHSFKIICLAEEDEGGEILIPEPSPTPPGSGPSPGPAPETGPSPESTPGPGPSPDDSTEPSPAPTTSEPEVTGFFPNLLAAAGNIFGNFWNNCYPCLPWWLIFVFAAYCLLQVLLNKKKDKEKLIKWLILAICLAVLAIIFYLVNYHCIAIWLLLLLASLIFILWRLWIISEKDMAWPEHRETENFLKRIKKDKILFLGAIILLILFIIYFILKCLHPWVIVTAFVLFILGIGLIKKKQK